MPVAANDAPPSAVTRPPARLVDQHIIEIVSNSGEGAQTCGQMFADLCARNGNGIWTVEIIPAEIEPPTRSRAGASGNRIRLGSKPVTNAGDCAHVIVALNEQVLYSRIDSGALREGTIVFVDCSWAENPDEEVRKRYAQAIADFHPRRYLVVEVPIEIECRRYTDDPRKGKNMWVFGLLCALSDPDSAPTVLLLDNTIYGLTKNQTSPTTHPGEKSNTHPKGSTLPPSNPIPVTLGIANAPFVAQTIDWNPPHLDNTIKAAFEHRGTSFARVPQRCPPFTSHIFAAARENRELTLLMTDEKKGIPLDPNIQHLFPNRVDHDPSDLDEAQALASRPDVYPAGLFYRNENAVRYDEIPARGLGRSQADKLAGMRRALARSSI